MARTWSTFNAPPQWGKITGIPSDFSDGKIDWSEIKNSPFATFDYTTISTTDLVINKRNANIFLQAQSGQFNAVYFQYPSGYSWAIATFGSLLQFVSFFDGIPINVNFQIDAQSGQIIIIGIPSSPANLPSGALWRDSNGFLRVV